MSIGTEAMSHTSDTKDASTAKAKTTYIISSNRLLDDKLESSQASQKPESVHMESHQNQSNHSRKISTAVHVTTLAQNRGESAHIQVPPLSADIRARLKALREFKAWGVRIQQNVEADANRTYQGDKPLLIPNLCVLRSRAFSQQNTDIAEAPTPFSSPQIVPDTAHNNPTERIETGELESETPPTFEPTRAEQPARPVAAQHSSSSRTITISSTPVAELVRRASIKSESAGRQAPARSKSRSKKYPPISYPIGFNEDKVVVRASRSRSRSRTRSSSQPRHGGNSVSPMTRPAATSTDSSHKNAREATPVDRRGRPVFYTTIHYFTECSHTSPPASRPINAEAQPRKDPNFNRTNPAISRSIIPGRCFNCETAHRRSNEDAVMTDFIGKVALLFDRLDSLLKKVELDVDSPNDEDSLSNDKYGALLVSQHKFPEDAQDLDHCLDGSVLPPLSDDPTVSNTLYKMRDTGLSFQERMGIQIRLLEADIRTIELERDSKIEEVWKGYTQRWGPGVLGVHKGVERYSTREYDQLAEHDVQAIKSNGGKEVVELVDGVQRLTVSGSANAAELAQTPTAIRNGSRSVSRGRRSHGGDSVDVFNNAPEHRISRSNSQVSHRDVPGSRTPGEAKMRIGWIRD